MSNTVNGITETRNGELIRAGQCDWSSDGNFDPRVETYHTDVPCPMYVQGKIELDLMLKYSNGVWTTVDQEPNNSRSYDGSYNNKDNIDWGGKDTALLRKSSSAYADSISTLATRGPSNPNPRIVSNAICKLGSFISSVLDLTDMTWIWGQFLDHEIDLTTPGSESADMVTPTVIEDPNEDYPSRTILFTRSKAVSGSNPRDQPNEISSYIDATNVYGSTKTRADILRLFDGSGKMKTLLANNNEIILDYNTYGLPNAAPGGSDPTDFFIAGDVRSNENIYLTAMHTLFVREHNRLCDEIVITHPDMVGKDNYIFEQARKIVIGLMQSITFSEFLPALGIVIPSYTAYDDTINSGVTTEFSTVGYRLGHSMLSSTLNVGSSGSINLKDAFFSPSYIQTNGVDDLLLGGTTKVMKEIDGTLVDDVRNFLFGPPTGSNLLDLAALNMQRGRDHGIPGYNDVRVAYGLSINNNFSDITSDTTIQNNLQQLYTSPDHIDPWIGAVVENHLSGKAVGELVNAILIDQFTNLRDGDYYWYEVGPGLSSDMITEISNTKLSDIIIRNTVLTSSEIDSDVFHV